MLRLQGSSSAELNTSIPSCFDIQACSHFGHGERFKSAIAIRGLSSTISVSFRRSFGRILLLRGVAVVSEEISDHSVELIM
jgi:hypothetical protein